MMAHPPPQPMIGYALLVAIIIAIFSTLIEQLGFGLSMYLCLVFSFGSIIVVFEIRQFIRNVKPKEDGSQ